MKNSVADLLIEALPYIKRFSGKTIVVKYGGHAMKDENLKKDFANDITLLKYIGVKPVVVHGGGPQINKVLDSMGITSKFIRGMRYTDDETMDVVEMVLGGKVNKDIVARINHQGGKAVGLTGKDGMLITARKMTIYHQEDASKPPEIIDPGMVGEVVNINPDIIHTLTDKGFIPIIAPVGFGKNGETYNINADIVASKIASALHAERLMLVTDVDGLLDMNKKLISSVDAASIKEMIAAGDIIGGMIPKVECAVDALKAGVKKSHIINGKLSHAVLLELFTDSGIGTQVFLD
ncbi:MAG: acetylglutamate kinase [Desulfobacula sp.]|jgi:acetylglutamate kinase|uniref:acetylglutamate kinase n=1 Tax=Desulfobacula sp. TaxID=2593537 RepID=UPI001D25B0AC|nr:acetylglutamate kinase [Desulfobacula sp.]MBT3486913.1 acetylglutamate kinase [Desulfobacula sp.]MBT3805611.1 acetylglutamate kinase [Desulfobacula sp.]MBT4026483.1 acetylglutamate kinase [Desulfobacula sp.]MBT4199626.1 acetylglutamate kinase [Desulfobacula sp.]